MVDVEQLKRWRLILGRESQDTLNSYNEEGFVLEEDYAIMDEALAAIYDETTESKGSNSGTATQRAQRNASLGASSPKLAKWLSDIRKYFPQDVVSVIQSDAIERKGLKQLLFEPETLKNIKPDINMVTNLMALKGKIPGNAKDTARELVKAVVDEITKRLENDLRQAVIGALNRKNHSPIPSIKNIDWKYTINRNLKNYNLQYKKIIPDRFYFFENGKRTKNWTVILDIDQSGSMADSVVYASVIGSIFASIPALDTRVVAFDTEVVDLTEQCANDPVDMLFGIQLGGGTDINKSITYCQQFITEPKRTMFILISDLYEGGNQAAMIRRMTEMHESGVKVISLLALSDSGAPWYDEHTARKLSSIGIPCFACTPNLLPEFLEGALKGYDLKEMAKKVAAKGIKGKY